MKKVVRTLIFILMLCFATNAFAAESYDDVTSSHWAYQAVKQLTDAGIISGVDKKTFDGNKPISRYEMAQMVFRAMEKYDKAGTDQKLLIDALRAEYNDVYQKVLTHDKKIENLEKNQERFSFSGMMSARYRNQNYSSPQTADTVMNQYRLRLDGKFKVDEDSFVAFRFVTKAPNKNNLFNDSWTNSGGENQMTANGTSNTYTNLIDRYFYAARLSPNTSIAIGEQALVIDPMNIIVDNTFYSYGGGKVSQKIQGLGNEAAVTVQYGTFYKGASFSGVTAATTWGNKKFNDFTNADVKSIILNGRVNSMKYQVGYADFRNTISKIDLLRYTFAEVGFLVTPKVGLDFEYGKNSADVQGQFVTGKITYGDQVLKKRGQWNVSYQYIDAQKNAIFNRYAMLEGAAGSNINHAQQINDARINYAFSPAASFYVQRLGIHDKEATASANGSSVLWKAELDVKF